MPDPSRKSPQLLIYDDGRGRFGPLTDRRASFSLFTGALNNRVRIETALGQMATALHVAPRLVERCRAGETDAWVNKPLRRDEAITFGVRKGNRWESLTVAGDADVLLVNGRWSGGPPVDPSRAASLRTNEALVQRDGQVIASVLPVDAAQTFIDGGFADLPPSAKRIWLDTDVLLARPWHILDQLEVTLVHDLAQVPEPHSSSAVVHPAAVLDQTRGPVVLGEETRIGPCAVIEGPCYIGRGSIVQPQTCIRPFTIVGDHCKVAGEISASIIHSYTNKAHYGYLGNSIVGEWVNLGAGTTVSNLKNTYGEVRMQIEPGASPEATGRMFLGPVIGDFVRTAIGTRIPTGSCVGTGSMLAMSGFAPKFVPRGRFITDDGDELADAERVVQTARAMMARRQVELSSVEEKLLRELLG